MVIPASEVSNLTSSKNFHEVWLDYTDCSTHLGSQIVMHLASPGACFLLCKDLQVSDDAGSLNVMGILHGTKESAAAWPGEDDLWASGGLPTRVPAPDRELEEVLDQNRLPNELLQEVLSYLPPSTLLGQSRQVCRRWVVDGWDLWRSILPWKHPDLWPVIRTCLPPADDPGPCILGRFCERRPIGRNLLGGSQSSRGLGGSKEEAISMYIS
ncbi:F-box only protein 27-like isoform X1 [Bos javanicus]|uniref:F-box only protein 27-like isoform X1 n=1 Tax=Bos javanicus TaxID=9906 RepID=UPI002AA6D7AC|nr:F-box only protein 27-like isoform X1 [Bos javanicus]